MTERFCFYSGLFADRFIVSGVRKKRARGPDATGALFPRRARARENRKLARALLLLIDEASAHYRLGAHGRVRSQESLIALNVAPPLKSHVRARVEPMPLARQLNRRNYNSFTVQQSIES